MMSSWAVGGPEGLSVLLGWELGLCLLWGPMKKHPPPLGCRSGLSLHSCSRSYPTPYNWKQLFHCYMDCCLKQSSQIYWNQECPHHAPQPKEPEASVCRWKGADFHAGSSNIDTPFQDSRKKFHHMRSEQKEAFR